MPAACYLCVEKIGAIPGGTPDNNPVGACGICHALACIGHAKREPTRPRYECVICMSIIASVSAAMRSRTPSPITADLPTLVASVGGARWLVKSVDEFFERYPEFRDWRGEIPTIRTRHAFQADDIRSFNDSLGEQGRDLMDLAVVMARELKIQSNLLPNPLQRFVESVR